MQTLADLLAAGWWLVAGSLSALVLFPFCSAMLFIIKML